MQKHRIISLASILAMLLIPVVGYFLVAQPQFAAAAAADQQRVDLEAQNAATSVVVETLRRDSANTDELNDELDALRTAIPATVDSEAYIDGLTAVAASAGVVISGLTVQDPSAYVTAVDPAAAAAPATDASAEGEEATEPVAAPPAVADPAIVTNPLITSETFVTVPVTVEVKGVDINRVMGFVKGLQSGDRLFLVTSISTTRDTASNDLVASVGGYIYVLPGGLEGNPHPTSTIVKIMDPVAPPVEEDGSETDGTETDGTDGADGTDDGTTPDPTNTPAP